MACLSSLITHKYSAPLSYLLNYLNTYVAVEYTLEGLMLKLKLQYFGHLRQRADSLEKTLMLGLKAGEGD